MKGRIFVCYACQHDVFFSAANCVKIHYFGKHDKQIFCSSYFVIALIQINFIIFKNYSLITFSKRFWTYRPPLPRKIRQTLELLIDFFFHFSTRYIFKRVTSAPFHPSSCRLHMYHNYQFLTWRTTKNLMWTYLGSFVIKN